MSKEEKKYKKKEGTVIAYHRYVQSIIAERLNSVTLGPGHTPCVLAKVFFPLSLAFLAVGLFLVCLRPHHLYLVGVWPRFLGPFFVILFILAFGASVFFYDLASRRSNKYRRKLKFRGYGLYGTKVLHDSHIEREKLLKEEYKSGTGARKPKAQRPRYEHRRGNTNEGYDPPGERGVRTYRPRADPQHRTAAPERQVYRERRDDRVQLPRDDRNGSQPVRSTEGYPELEMAHIRDRQKLIDRTDNGRRYDTSDVPPPVYRGHYAQGADQRRRDPRHDSSRYDAPPDRFYDEVPINIEPAESHHVVSRRTAQPAERYSERNVDDSRPGALQGHPQYQIQFDTDASDTAV